MWDLHPLSSSASLLDLSFERTQMPFNEGKAERQLDIRQVLKHHEAGKRWSHLAPHTAPVIYT